MHNVTMVVENNICTGCCECIGACSANNICIMMSKTHDHPVPFISDDSACIECEACLRACPQGILLEQTTA